MRSARVIELDTDRGGARIWLVRVTTFLIVLYAIFYSVFTAPSRFLNDTSYDAKLVRSPITADMIRLELPANAADLAKTMQADVMEQHPSWYPAQLKLYRVAQDWDNVFIEIYVLQYLSLVLVIGGGLRGLTGFARVLAGIAILITGIFDWLENIRIHAILYPGVPPFAKDLVEQLKSASETKWTAFSISCLLLSLLVWRLPIVSRTLRIELVASLFGAAAFVALGCFPGYSQGLKAGTGLYIIMPIIAFWSFVLHPAIHFLDERVRGSESQFPITFKALGLVGPISELKAAPLSEIKKEPPKWSLNDLEK
jgi:hypothetical protein